MAKQKTLLERMKGGEFIVSVQIDTPGLGTKMQEYWDDIRKLKKAGVWLVDINSSRRVSYDSIYLAGKLKRMGFEVIPHVTTRDSSVDALINLILIANREDKVKNFLIITGDPREGKHAKFSTGVFQTDSAGALGAVNGQLKIGGPMDLSLAAAVNQNATDLSKEAQRIKSKEYAGADFFMSQPVFCESEVKKLFGFYHAYSTRPLIIGIWPLVSKRTVLSIRRGNIVGVVLSDKVYSEAEPFFNDEEALTHWGLEKARKLVEFIRHAGYAQGVYIVAPSRNPLLLLDILPKIL